MKFKNSLLMILLFVGILTLSSAAVFVPGITGSTVTDTEYTWGDLIVNGTSWDDPIGESLNFSVINSTGSVVYSALTTNVTEGFHTATFNTTVADNYFWVLTAIDGTYYNGGFFESEVAGGGSTSPSGVCATWNDDVCPDRYTTGVIT